MKRNTIMLILAILIIVVVIVAVILYGYYVLHYPFLNYAVACLRSQVPRVASS